MDKVGTSGTPVNVVSNVFGVDIRFKSKMFLYRVEFDPPCEMKGHRIGMLRSVASELERSIGKYHTEGSNVLGEKKVDGVTLTTMSPNKKETRITIAFSVDVDREGQNAIQWYNIVVDDILRGLGMICLNKDYFNRKDKFLSVNTFMQLWPGVHCSVTKLDFGMALIIDVVFKVLHKRSMYDVILEHLEMFQGRNCSLEEAQKKTENKLRGKVILSTYNFLTVTIHSIDWKRTPADTFTKADGTETSFADYFRAAYYVNHINMEQPLIISKGRGGKGECVYLPDLTIKTGIDERDRNDGLLMRDLATATRIDPVDRLSRSRSTAKMIKEAGGDVIELSTNPVTISARCLKREPVYGGGGRALETRGFDWLRSLSSVCFLRSVALLDWYVVHSEKTRRDVVVDFFHKAISFLRSAGTEVKMPKILVVSDENGIYETTARDVDKCNPRPQLIVFVLAYGSSELYKQMKSLLFTDKGIQCQCIRAKTLCGDSRTNPRSAQKLASIVTKVSCQMAVKIGGSVWGVCMPRGFMLVGVDIYHDDKMATPSIGALVATMDEHFSRFYSLSSRNPAHVELLGTSNQFMKRCLEQYRMINGAPPSVVVVYRDGVGDGQLTMLCTVEAEEMAKAVRTDGEGISFYYAVVKKRISTRFFREGSSDNPPAGLVVDKHVTKNGWRDFYLVSQNVKGGARTVTPTHINLIYTVNESLTIDQFQMLTYQSTFAYQNWAGTIRTPSVCQYAHKQAFMCGQCMEGDPHSDLHGTLFYV